MPRREEMSLALDNIFATQETQPRATMDMQLVKQYAQDMRDGAIFPNLVVFNEEGSERYILADGFHRLMAAYEVEAGEFMVDVWTGGMHEARRFAFGANVTHGARRTNKDKRRAVTEAIKDPAFEGYTQVEIADICRVTERTVRNIATDLRLAEDEKKKRKKKGKGEDPVEPSEDDVRPAKKLTQEQAETNELREALKTIMAFPYGGEDTDERMLLTDEDVGNCDHCAAWLHHVVLVHRKG